MLLDEYIARKKLSQTELAEKLKIGRPMLSQILQRKRRMRPDTAIKVNKITKGAVTRDEAIFPEFYPDWRIK